MNEDVALRQVSQEIDFEKELPVSCKWLNTIPKGTKKVLRVFLVLTEFSIYIFERNEKTSALVKKYAFSLFQLQNGATSASGSFELSFPGVTLPFSGDEVSCIFDLIATQIHSIRLPRDIPQLKGAFNLNANNSRSFFSVLARFRGLLRDAGRYPPPEVISELEAYLKTSPKMFDLSAVPLSAPYYYELLSSLEIEPLISHIVFDGNLWGLFASIFKTNTTFKRITASGIITGDFAEFCSSVAKNPDAVLQRMDFSNMEISSESISCIMTSLPAVVVSFTSCKFEGPPELICELCASEKLLALHFSNINLSDRTDLVRASSSLTNVSFRECNVEVFHVLALFSESKIETMNLSRNLATVPMKTRTRFPPNLRKFVVNDINWTVHTLRSILTLASDAINKIFLSICRARMKDLEWQEFFYSLKTAEPASVSSMIWKENPLHFRLLEYWMKIPSMTLLSIAGCHIPGSGALNRFLESHPSIESLDISGAGGNVLSKTFIGIVSSLASMKKLRNLDISRNSIGMSAAIPLNEFLSTHPHISEVYLDENGLEWDAIDAIGQISTERNINIVFPEKDAHSAAGSDSKVLGLKRSYMSTRKTASLKPGDIEWRSVIYQGGETEWYQLEEPYDRLSREEALSTDLAMLACTRIGNALRQSKKVGIDVTWSLDTVEMPRINNDSIIPALQEAYSLRASRLRLCIINKA